MVELSVILITWNAEQYVQNCFDSLLESTQGFSREIIVVDNGSTDSTPEMIKLYASIHPEIRFIANKENLGVAGGRNIALKEATGEYVWILDIDTIANRMAFESMMDYIVQDKACGICTCKLKNSYGNVQDSCRRLPTFRYKLYNALDALFSKIGFAKGLKRLVERLNNSQFYHEQMSGNEPFEAEYVIGACQLVRKQALDEVGLLDDKIFYGPEDADFCLRLRKKGWSVVYLPFVSIIHEYQQITNKNLFSRMSLIHTKALFYFFWKHKRF